MKRKALIVFQSILGYMALVYCGPRVIEGEYIWLSISLKHSKATE